jgi:hypothetical protein
MIYRYRLLDNSLNKKIKSRVINGYSFNKKDYVYSTTKLIKLSNFVNKYISEDVTADDKLYMLFQDKSEFVKKYKEIKEKDLEIIKKQKEDKEKNKVDYEKLTKKEIMELLDSKNISYNSNLKKSELLNLLVA